MSCWLQSNPQLSMRMHLLFDAVLLGMQCVHSCMQKGLITTLPAKSSELRV